MRLLSQGEGVGNRTILVSSPVGFVSTLLSFSSSLPGSGLVVRERLSWVRLSLGIMHEADR